MTKNAHVEPLSLKRSCSGTTYMVFKSNTTLRSHSVRAKDTVNPARQDSEVYRIPCKCGKIYIGETGRPMQERMKEHERDIHLASTQTSAVSEHANKRPPPAL